MHPDRVRAILAKARMHLNFVCSLYEEQIRGGRFFIHEHPAGATSWEEPAVKRILKLPEVRVSRVDACQYGMTGISEGKEHPVKKPTRWMSNMKGVNEVLSRTCGENAVSARMDVRTSRARGKERSEQLFTHYDCAERSFWGYAST
jgi:hypothetical protein